MNTVVQKVEDQAIETTAVLSMIERVALNPEVDIAKLEKMLDLQERILNRNAEQAFNSAMASAQQSMGRVSADATNPQTRSNYASYAAIDRALRPTYTSNGFSLSFDTGDGPDGHVRVLCYVAHREGHCRTYHVDMPSDGLGAKGGAVMTKTHAAGSAMSYGMRYLLKLIFNVAVGEDDDDGNSAGALPDGLLEAVRELETAPTMEELQSAFQAAWSSFPDKSARASLTAIKDARKRSLANG